MKTGIILQLATLMVLILLGTSTEALFFSYPKNALVQFFQSLHGKKEVKRPHNIHHWHLHYYPVQTQVWTKAIKAPDHLELDKLHSNHLETLGWGDHEYGHVPEPVVYSPPPLHDPWPESSLTRPWSWDDALPDHPSQTAEHPEQLHEVPKSGIIVQVPLHQKIIVQQPAPKEEKPETNPLVAFFHKLRRIKNSIFSERNDSEEEVKKPKPIDYSKLNAFVVYVKPEYARKL